MENLKNILPVIALDDKGNKVEKPLHIYSDEASSERSPMYQEALKKWEQLQKAVELIPLSEFVKKLVNDKPNTSLRLIEKLCEIDEYTHLITQPLTKGMFIPCDEEGNVLDTPDFTGLEIGTPEHIKLTKHWDKWVQAKKRVIFEKVIGNRGVVCDIDELKSFHEFYKTIEQAINNGVKLYYKIN